jgi:hypothetical protein
LRRIRLWGDALFVRPPKNRRFAPPVIQTDNRWITGGGPPVNWLANSSG